MSSNLARVHILFTQCASWRGFRGMGQDTADVPTAELSYTKAHQKRQFVADQAGPVVVRHASLFSKPLDLVYPRSCEYFSVVVLRS